MIMIQASDSEQRTHLCIIDVEEIELQGILAPETKIQNDESDEYLEHCPPILSSLFLVSN